MLNEKATPPLIAYGDNQPDLTKDDPNRVPVGEGSAVLPDPGRPVPDTPAKRDDHWLCTFEVKVDLPRTLYPGEMEAAIADCLAVRLPALGYHGNCIVTLLWTSDQSVQTCTDNSTRRIA